MKTKKIVWHFLLLGVLVATQGVPDEPFEETVGGEKGDETDENRPKGVPEESYEESESDDSVYEEWSEVHPFNKDIEGSDGNRDDQLQYTVDKRRPVWNIAHMANSIADVDFYLRNGANSIEVDVTFQYNGDAQYTYHGMPCDCFRWCFSYETVPTYLDHLRQLTTPGNPKFKEQLVLFVLDIKLSSSINLIAAGKDMARNLLKHYWNHGKPGGGGRAYIINSLPSINYASFIVGFQKGINEAGASQYFAKIGYDFSDNEDLDKIRNTYERFNIKTQIWQSDGITNCLPRSTERLLKAIYRRDRGGLTSINKIYWWTVDKKNTMEKVLSLGVDAVMTNYPSNMAEVLNQANMKKIVRLATFTDNPFVKHTSGFAHFRMPLNISVKPEIVWNI